MKKILLLVLAALVAFPQIGSAKKNESEGLKVMSYNVRLGVGKDGTNSWQYRCPATIMMLEEYAPDVFGVQEAYDFQVKFITEFARDYKCVGVGREDGKKEGEHMSIFWNKKTVSLLKWGTYWLSETPDEPSYGWGADYRRTMTWAKMEMKYSGKKFFYVNTHLDSDKALARSNGLKLILDKIAEKNTDNLPVVLTGDFNIIPTDSVLDVLDDAEMLDARTTATKTDNLATFNGFGDEEERVIDYIYYRGFSSCPEYETIVKQYDENIQYISDHYPIVARLMF